jgi:hypothetical protein
MSTGVSGVLANAAVKEVCGTFDGAPTFGTIMSQNLRNVRHFRQDIERCFRTLTAGPFHELDRFVVQPFGSANLYQQRRQIR